VRLVELQIREAEGRQVRVEDWEEILARVRESAVIDEAVEVHYLAAVWARGRGQRDLVLDWVARAREVSRDSPIWRERLTNVSAETTDH